MLPDNPLATGDLESRLRSAGSDVAEGFRVRRFARFDRLAWVYVEWEAAAGPYPKLYRKLEAVEGVARSEPNPNFREAGRPAKADPELRDQWNLLG
ncbi:MAG: hypothetical protein K8I02_04775, partial [Candidatus Methylomirabilis sp.]|nr:hypothetical protein [Deltaproteobacteria bacterium]